MNMTSYPTLGERARKLWGRIVLTVRFHYKPSVAWPPPPGDGVTVKLPDGSEEHFDEQIQMYWCVHKFFCHATWNEASDAFSPNNMLTHPLVSPVNVGSLGGLCPLLIVSSLSDR